MISKSEIRKEIFHSTGCEADDWLEGSRRSANAFEGAKKALKKSAQEVLSIATVIKKDLEDGKLDKMEAAEIADYAILQVMRAKDSLMNGSQHYENRQLSMQGEIGAYTKLVNHFKVQHDREEAKIQSIEDAIESGEIVIDEDGEPAKQAGRGQITGVRPTAGLAAQRKAEAEAEKNASAEDSPEDGAPSEDVVEAEAEKPKKKRKKRKTKTEAPEDNAPDGENT
jgi:hypothetical protein